MIDRVVCQLQCVDDYDTTIAILWKFSNTCLTFGIFDVLASRNVIFKKNIKLIGP